jgi:hypothetical protein
MHKQLITTTVSESAGAGEERNGNVAEVPQKRGFKPRWLRLQRRERKLKEAQARALALRPVVG